MGWWVADLLERNPAMLVSWVVWVIGSIALHELAHGWAAIRCGDRTPIELRRMTWNPIVHMGGLSLIIFAVVGIAWGMMPVNPSRFRRHIDAAIVAAAGPAMNLALAIVSMVCGGLWLAFASGVPDPFNSNVLIFFHAGAFLNLVLMGLNLLPVPPLDGSRILAVFSPVYARLIVNNPQGSTIAFFLVFAMIFMFSDVVWGPAVTAALFGRDLVALLFL